MHLLLAGGGTAGHIMPNLALIELCKQKNPKLNISYIGSYHGLENKLLQDQPVQFYQIFTGKFRRYFSIQNFFDLFKVPLGFLQSCYYVHKIKPDLIFSKGGYVSLPVVFAGWIFRVPIIIHESDATPGLTTKLTAYLATEIWGSHSELVNSLKHKFKQVHLPIRSQLKNATRQDWLSRHPLDSARPTLLFMGGSLGAGSINDFVFNNLEELTSKFNLIHICGQGKLSKTQKTISNYLAFEYLDNEMAAAYAAADLVISRAGASSISELLELNKKAILIPLPTSKSRGEQLLNAKEFLKFGNGQVIEENNLVINDFLQTAENLLSAELKPFDPQNLLRFQYEYFEKYFVAN